MEENKTNETPNREEHAKRENANKNAKGEARENREPNRRRFKPRQPKTDEANGTEKPRNQRPQNQNRTRHNPRFKKQEGENTNEATREKPKRHKNYGNKDSSATNASNLELRKAVELNAKIHESTLTLHSQVEVNPNGRVRITPLGGLGEIGGNMTIIESPWRRLMMSSIVY